MRFIQVSRRKKRGMQVLKFIEEHIRNRFPKLTKLFFSHQVTLEN